jgi:hypothetical protein
MVKVMIKALLAVGVVALIGAAAYAVLARRGGETSFATFPDVPVNPASQRAA